MRVVASLGVFCCATACLDEGRVIERPTATNTFTTELIAVRRAASPGIEERILVWAREDGDPEPPFDASADDEVALLLYARPLVEVGLNAGPVPRSASTQSRPLPPADLSFGLTVGQGLGWEDGRPAWVDGFRIASVSARACLESGLCLTDEVGQCTEECGNVIPDSPAAPDAPMRVTVEACSAGFVESVFGEAQFCRPNALPTCDADEFGFLGSASCAPISVCSGSRFANDVPAGTLYVDAQAPLGGNGTLNAPFRDLEAAVSLQPPAIALASGSHQLQENLSLNSVLQLVGNCPQESELVVPESISLTIDAQVDVRGVRLEILGSIQVNTIGDLSLSETQVLGASTTSSAAITVTGMLRGGRVVFDGLSRPVIRVQSGGVELDEWIAQNIAGAFLTADTDTDVTLRSALVAHSGFAQGAAIDIAGVLDLRAFDFIDSVGRHVVLRPGSAATIADGRFGDVEGARSSGVEMTAATATLERVLFETPAAGEQDVALQVLGGSTLALSDFVGLAQTATITVDRGMGFIEGVDSEVTVIRSQFGTKSERHGCLSGACAIRFFRQTGGKTILRDISVTDMLGAFVIGGDVVADRLHYQGNFGSLFRLETLDIVSSSAIVTDVYSTGGTFGVDPPGTGCDDDCAFSIGLKEGEDVIDKSELNLKRAAFDAPSGPPLCVFSDAVASVEDLRVSATDRVAVGAMVVVIDSGKVELKKARLEGGGGAIRQRGAGLAMPEFSAADLVIRDIRPPSNPEEADCRTGVAILGEGAKSGEAGRIDLARFVIQQSKAGIETTGGFTAITGLISDNEIGISVTAESIGRILGVRLENAQNLVVLDAQ